MLNSIQIMGNVTKEDIESIGKPAYEDLMSDFFEAGKAKKSFLAVLNDAMPGLEEEAAQDIAFGFQLALVFVRQKGLLNVSNQTEAVSTQTSKAGAF